MPQNQKWQQGHHLQFDCQSCKEVIPFSLFELEKKKSHHLECPKCKKKYIFSDENLLRQIKKFEALCCQIRDSEEILSNTAVGIDVGDRHIKMPFKLLLTRLNSSLDLMIGNAPLSIVFRIEPLKDIPSASQ